MSVHAIRCPGCKKLVNVEKLEEHYKDGKHEAGIEDGATTITTANPHHEIPEWAKPLFANTPHPKADKPHLFDNPVWGPLLRRFFPHILFGTLAVGVVIGILLW